MPSDREIVESLQSVLEEERQRSSHAALHEMERLRDRMDQIRKNPKKEPSSYNQATLTGSFLEALGIRKPKHGRKPEVELNMEEINEREEKAIRARKQRERMQQLREEYSGVKAGVKTHKKRSRTRRKD